MPESCLTTGGSSGASERTLMPSRVSALGLESVIVCSIQVRMPLFGVRRDRSKRSKLSRCSPALIEHDTPLW